MTEIDQVKILLTISIIKQVIETLDKWSGFNFFFCKGKFIAGPSHTKPFLSTSVLILVPFVLFLIFNTQVVV